MANQNVQDILNYLNQNAVAAQEINFDFAEWENNLQQQFNKNNSNGIVSSIKRYIEMVMTCTANKPCKEQILSSRVYFNRLLPILQRLLETTVLIKVTQMILDIIIVENRCIWCIKKELLKIYNNWFLEKEIDVRNDVIKQLPPIYLFKLMDSICTNGDYDLQKTIIETIHGLYPMDILLSNRELLIPESEELCQTFLNVHSETFNRDCRLFLNAMNKKKEKIYSMFCCKYIQIGDTCCKPPEINEGGLWVDFNLEDKAISWYYNKAQNLDETSWELVTLFASDVDNYSWEIDESQINEVKVHLKLKGDLVLSSPNHDLFVRQAKSVTIIAENNQFIVQNFVANVLAKIFENFCTFENKTSEALNYDVRSTKSASKSCTTASKSEISTAYKLLKSKLSITKNQDEIITILSSENSCEITSPKKIDQPFLANLTSQGLTLTNELKEKSQEPIKLRNTKISQNCHSNSPHRINIDLNSNLIVNNANITSTKFHEDSQGSTIIPEEPPNQAHSLPEEPFDPVRASETLNMGYENFGKVLTESINSIISKEKSLIYVPNVSSDMGNKNNGSDLAERYESAIEYIQTEFLHESISREFHQKTSTPKKSPFFTEMYRKNESQLTGNFLSARGSNSLTRTEDLLEDDATNEEILNIWGKPKSKVSENFESARDSFYRSESDQTCVQDDVAAEAIIKHQEKISTIREDDATITEIVNVLENLQSKISVNKQYTRKSPFLPGSQNELLDVTSTPQEKVSTVNVPNETFQDNLTSDLQSARTSINLTGTEDKLQGDAINEEIANIWENPKSKISENFESARESLHWSVSERISQEVTATDASREPQEKISSVDLINEMFQDNLTSHLTRTEVDATNEEIANVWEDPKSKISENFESARESLHWSVSERISQEVTATDASRESQKNSSVDLINEVFRDSLTSHLTRTEVDATNEEIAKIRESPNPKVSENIQCVRNFQFTKALQDGAGIGTLSQPQEKISTAITPNETIQDYLTSDSQFARASTCLIRTDEMLQDGAPNEEIVNKRKKPTSETSEIIQQCVDDSLYWTDSQKTLKYDTPSEASSEPLEKISSVLPNENFQVGKTSSNSNEFPKIQSQVEDITSKKIITKNTNQNSSHHEEIVETTRYQRIQNRNEKGKKIKRPFVDITSKYNIDTIKTLEEHEKRIMIEKTKHQINPIKNEVNSTEITKKRLPKGKQRTTSKSSTKNNLDLIETVDEYDERIRTEKRTRVDKSASITTNNEEGIKAVETSKYLVENPVTNERNLQANVITVIADVHIPAAVNEQEMEETIQNATEKPNEEVTQTSINIISDQRVDLDEIEHEKRQTKVQLNPNENEINSTKIKKKRKITSKLSTKNNYDLIETVSDVHIPSAVNEQKIEETIQKTTENPNEVVTQTSINIISDQRVDLDEIEHEKRQTKVQINPNENEINSTVIEKKRKITSKPSTEHNYDLIEIVSDVPIPAAFNEQEIEETIQNATEKPNEVVPQTSINIISDQRVDLDEIEHEKRLQPVKRGQIDDEVSTVSTVFPKKRKRRKLYDPSNSYDDIINFEETTEETMEANQFTSAKSQSNSKTDIAKKDTTKKKTTKKSPTKKTTARKTTGKRAARLAYFAREDSYNFKRKYLFKIKSTTKDQRKEKRSLSNRKFYDICPDTSNFKSPTKLRGIRFEKVISPLHGTPKKPFGFDLHHRYSKKLENGDNLFILDEKYFEDKSLLYKEIWNWSAESYYKGKFVKIYPNDYFGKYLLILFYPLDFGQLPHCEAPKEVIEINENYEQFTRLNTELLCCSVDSVSTHKRWIEGLKIKDLKFPLLEDTTHAISNEFKVYCSPFEHSYRLLFI
ncbi:unnamed protein product, partial [Phyllotreta striolata]